MSTPPSSGSRHISRRSTFGLAPLLGLTPFTATACSSATESDGEHPHSSTAPLEGRRRQPLGTDAENRLVLLGTSGGPPWWLDSHREGIASAVAIGENYYLIDAGDGVGKQIKRARLGSWDQDGRGPLDGLAAVFLTHLHSDHISDLYNLIGTGLQNGVGIPDRALRIIGPGDRGALPVNENGIEVDESLVVNPDDPTPGTAGVVRGLLKTFATDFNDRITKTAYPPLDELFVGEDVELADELTRDPNGEPHPRMSPVEVFEDDRVKVTATLVQHAPVFPAFAFRFDTDTGSVTFSGDTGPSENLIELAAGSDILVHEVVSEEWAGTRYPEPRDDEAEAGYQHMLQSHTVVEDVGRIAEQAEVGTLVLNHFVPGNGPVEEWEKAQEGFSGELILGEDLDAIPIGS